MKNPSQPRLRSALRGLDMGNLTDEMMHPKRPREPDPFYGGGTEDEDDADEMPDTPFEKEPDAKATRHPFRNTEASELQQSPSSTGSLATGLPKQSTEASEPQQSPPSAGSLWHVARSGARKPVNYSKAHHPQDHLLPGYRNKAKLAHILDEDFQ
jgi:hypothetical protein